MGVNRHDYTKAKTQLYNAKGQERVNAIRYFTGRGPSSTDFGTRSGMSYGDELTYKRSLGRTGPYGAMANGRTRANNSALTVLGALNGLTGRSPQRRGRGTAKQRATVRTWVY